MTSSILLTIKKMLGIAEEYHAFDIDIITNINAVFLSLNQLGIGPTIPYYITGEDETWMGFMGDQKRYLAGVQTYVYQRVRLMFDPPTNSFLVDALQRSCQELEWRFSVQPKTEEEVEYVESFKIEYSKKDESSDNNNTDDPNQNGSTDPPNPTEPTDPENPEEHDTSTDQEEITEEKPEPKPDLFA